ncbi:MAG TPA: signal peptidase II [Pseudomonadales bacterium]|nr:signal peptidase II [Pseudomonadales bacterium]
MTLQKANARWLLVSLAVFLLDQYSKQLVAAHFDYREVLPVFSVSGEWGVNLTLAHNTGAAFSFLAHAGGWQRWFFATIALLVSGSLTVWLLRLLPRQRWLAFALALLVGGALGNFLDRALMGYVIDFVDAYYGTYHWPAFNVADSAICVGAILLLLENFLDKKT